MPAKKGRNYRPAMTDEGRESKLVSLALDLAEKQLRDGTASSQVVTHLLKISSTREKLELERLERENLLLAAKADQIASAKRVEELYERALNAMRGYAGEQVELYDDDDQDAY